MSSTNELRLFISSTFRDLGEEREHLVKKIFPEIRAICRNRGITFTEIDLRWGVTAEEAEQGGVTRICLEEIDKCRPYFIGLTGDRYGWVPDIGDLHKDPHLLTDYPWVVKAAEEGASITDIEFRHGSLRDLERGTGTSYFYFRNLQADSLVDGSDERLEELKERVRATGLPTREYDTPEDLGEMVYHDLIAILDRDFADATPPTLLEEERSRHAAFAISRLRAYIPNAEYLAALDQWFISNQTPLILRSESGSGKSSLLAYWTEQMREKEPNLDIIEHYVGLGAVDYDHLGIIRHIMEEIKERYDRTEEIPTKPQEIERDFANWLGFGSGRPMLIVIDGINQLPGHGGELHWLPPVMPEGVKLIISTAHEHLPAALNSLGWSELPLRQLKREEREKIIVRFLAGFRKSLSAEQLATIAADPKSGHPLFLRTLLEELRVYGIHEELDRRIATLLSTTDTDDLFQQVLIRMEEDHSLELVQTLMGLIWGSRNGLSEDEMERISDTSRLDLSRFLLGLDYHLLRRNGRLTFFHDYLRRAVEKRYLSHGDVQRKYWHQLAEHFEVADVTLSSTLELLSAREKLEEREDIERILTEMKRFHLLWKSDPEEVLRLWSGHKPEHIVDAYGSGLRETLEEIEKKYQLTAMFGVATLYQRLGAWEAARSVLAKLIDIARRQEDRRAEAEALSLLSPILRDLDQIEEAESMARLAEAVARKIGSEEILFAALGTQGYIYLERGEHSKAFECFREQEKIARELGTEIRVADALGNRGFLHIRRSENQEALQCLSEGEQIARRLGNRRQRARAIGSLGLVYKNLGRFDRALECYHESVQIFRDLGDLWGVAVNTGSQGALHQMIGNYDQATACYREQEKIHCDLRDTLGQGIAVGNRGIVYLLTSEHRLSLSCLQEAIAIHRKTNYLHGLAYWLEGRGRLLVETFSSYTATNSSLPSWISEHFPHFSADNWLQEVLVQARKDAEETAEISRKTSARGRLLASQILIARIVAAEGDTEGAVNDLMRLLDEATDDEEKADLLYWLGNLDPNGRHYHAKSLRLYRRLYEETVSVHFYKERLAELESAIDTEEEKSAAQS